MTLGPFNKMTLEEFYLKVVFSMGLKKYLAGRKLPPEVWITFWECVTYEFCTFDKAAKQMKELIVGEQPAHL